MDAYSTYAPVYMEEDENKLLFSAGLPYNLRKSWNKELPGGPSICFNVTLELSTF